MSEIMKVITLDVGIPKIDPSLSIQFKGESKYSDKFSIIFEGKTSEWKLRCNLNDRNESVIGLYLYMVSGKPPPKIQCQFEVVDRNKCKNNIKKFIVENWEKDEGKGINMIMHTELNIHEVDWFPNGEIRFIGKVVAKGRDGKLSEKYRSLDTVSDLRNLYQSMNFSDIIIKTSDDKEFPAHKLILSTRSTVFEAMFQHKGMTESVSGVINAKDLHSDVVKEMLRFIYCEAYFNKLETATDQTIEVYYAAEKYNLKNLKTFCMKAIHEDLDSQNALKYLFFAETYGLSDLYRCCLLMIYANFESIIEADEWKAIRQTTKEKLLVQFIKNSSKMTIELKKTSTLSSDDI